MNDLSKVHEYTICKPVTANANRCCGHVEQNLDVVHWHVAKIPRKLNGRYATAEGTELWQCIDNSTINLHI